jgi:stage V sporulation protein R
MGNLTPELAAFKERIKERAAAYGLDFYDVIFELIDHDELNMIAAYGGFPTRYPHWRFGMEFEEMTKGYTFGLSKIYELVINNDPCYAYLMRSNSLTDQKLVMAHVYGHCLAPETLVTTAGGPKPIARIVPGELVVTHRGRERAVTAVSRRMHVGKAFRIEVRGAGVPVVLTGEHPVLVSWDAEPRAGAGGLVWRPAGRLVPGDHVVLPVDPLFADGAGGRAAATGTTTLLARRITAITELAYRDPVHNLAVDEDESFLVSGAFAVHNCDFFKNNLWFSRTHRKMMDVMANHGTRIRAYMDRHGVEKVETFVDTVLSLDNLIDIHAPFIQRAAPVPRASSEETPPDSREVPRMQAKDYMDRYINPPDFLESQKRLMREENAQKRRFPPEPARDVLKFMLDHGPLERWEQDILAMLRDEAYYFAPQGMTKIMNEGWAVYWHSTIMTRHMLGADEVVDYADHHSGTLGTRPGQINPYKLGVELYRDIEERWDKGKFGLEYDECDDEDVKRRWDKGLMQGRAKIFEVRKVYNDVSFVDEFLTEEFAEAQKLFVYGFNQRTGRYEIVDRDYRKVKEQLLWALTNFGQPVISVVDGNHKNRGELYLVHQWGGVDLKFDDSLETLKRVYSLWRRPVHLETREGGKPRLMSFDGKEAVIKEIKGSGEPKDTIGQATEDA